MVVIPDRYIRFKLPVCDEWDCPVQPLACLLHISKPLSKKGPLHVRGKLYVLPSLEGSIVLQAKTS